MGILKDLFGSSSKESRPEKTERVDVRDYGERMEVYDNQGHIKEEHRWNPHTDRWDKLDLQGNVTGHIERDSSGNTVHKDYFENVTGVDKREGSRTVAHYDSKGNKIGYTTRDYSNNLTRHTYTNETKKKESGSGLLGFLSEAAEYGRRMQEVEKQYDSLRNQASEETREEDDDGHSLWDDEDDYDYSYEDDYDEDDDPYADEYDADDEYDDDEYDD